MPSVLHDLLFTHDDGTDVLNLEDSFLSSSSSSAYVPVPSTSQGRGANSTVLHTAFSTDNDDATKGNGCAVCKAADEL